MITRRPWGPIRLALVIGGAVAVVVAVVVSPPHQRSYPFLAYTALLSLDAWLAAWLSPPRGRRGRYWAAALGTLVTLFVAVAVYRLR